MRNSSKLWKMLPMSKHLQCDVVVMGGGPAGSATGAFLAQAGLGVIVVEGEKHPRHHIGESLLPGSIPIFNRLGISSDELARRFQPKFGARFYDPDDNKMETFGFEPTPWQHFAAPIRSFAKSSTSCWPTTPALPDAPFWKRRSLKDSMRSRKRRRGWGAGVKGANPSVLLRDGRVIRSEFPRGCDWGVTPLWPPNGSGSG